MPFDPTADPRLEEHFNDLTTGSLDGKGLFDHLMRTVHAHLLEEYESQRIRGTDWSKVYLGSMEATLANAVQYLLGVGLLSAQLDKLTAETALVEQQKLNAELEAQQIAAQTNLLISQKSEVDYRVANLLPREVDLLNQNIIKVIEEINLIRAKTNNENKNLIVLDKQIELLTQQAAQYLRETNVKKAKIVADAWSAKAVADGSWRWWASHIQRWWLLGPVDEHIFE